MAWSKADAQEFFSPFTPSLVEVVTSAFSDWQTQYLHVSPILTVRTGANIVRDHMVHHARRVFTEMKEAQILESAGLFLVQLQHAGKTAIVRFKKFNDDEHTSNYPTQQAQDYHEQTELPFMPEKAPRFEVGWQPNELGTAFRALISHPREIGQNFWVMDLLAPAITEDIPAGTQLEIPEKKKRVHVKAQPIKKAKETSND